MIEQPRIDELLDAVIGWLGEAPAGAAEGFHRRVAANALSIVARQVREAPAAEAAAVARMTAILGRDGSHAELNAVLADALRDGVVRVDDPPVFEHLRLTALATLAIDQPRYRHELSPPRGE